MNEKLNELKEDAIAVLKDFFDAGGSIIAGGHDYSMIGEDFNLDEPIILLTYSNLYVIITVVLNKRKKSTMAHDETKANELYNSMVDKVYSLSIDQLIDLQDLVNGAIENIQMEKMIDLQNKAINALKDYYEAGGSLCSSLENFYIDESQEYDDDFYHIHLR